MSTPTITNRQYLKVAVPFIFSTVTEPLLGAVNTAVVGRLDNAAYIAGVSLGTVIFNNVFWLLNFLRVSTTTFSAQSAGMEEGRLKAQTDAFFQPAFIAAFFSAAILLLQKPILALCLKAFAPEPIVAQHCATYFHIMIWATPFMLMNYVILGWLMGQSCLRESLTHQLGCNIINISLDLLFVFGLGLGVAGVAAATLISHISGFCLGVFFIRRRAHFELTDLRQMLNLRVIGSMMKLNKDYMIRIACLLIQTNLFTARGTALGTDILSANTILTQVLFMITYSFDGLANATSVFAGRSYGAGDRRMLSGAWRQSFFWGGILVVLWTGAYSLIGGGMVSLFTDLENLLAIAAQYKNWILLFPLCSGIGLVIFGIFTGLGLTPPLRDSMIMALAVFLILWWGLRHCGNHGLWAALLGFYTGRFVFLLPYYKSTFRKLEARIFGIEPAAHS